MIVFGVFSIILLLCYLVYVVKVVVSVDVLFDGCLLFGVVFGDWFEEFLVLNVLFEMCGVRFWESFDYIWVMIEMVFDFINLVGRVGGGMDMLFKLVVGKLLILIMGGS